MLHANAQQCTGEAEVPGLAAWEAACDEFDAMAPADPDAWIEKVRTTYPRMDDMPDPESYNDIH